MLDFGGVKIQTGSEHDETRFPFVNNIPMTRIGVPNPRRGGEWIGVPEKPCNQPVLEGEENVEGRQHYRKQNQRPASEAASHYTEETVSRRETRSSRGDRGTRRDFRSRTSSDPLRLDGHDVHLMKDH